MELGRSPITFSWKFVCIYMVRCLNFSLTLIWFLILWRKFAGKGEHFIILFLSINRNADVYLCIYIYVGTYLFYEILKRSTNIALATFTILCNQYCYRFDPPVVITCSFFFFFVDQTQRHDDDIASIDNTHKHLCRLSWCLVLEVFEFVKSSVYTSFLPQHTSAQCLFAHAIASSVVVGLCI